MSLTPYYTASARLSEQSGGRIIIESEDNALRATLTPFFVGAATGTPFVHVQETALSIWTLTHNLGYIGDPTVYDENQEIILGDVTHDSETRLTIRFSEPVSGTARVD